MRYAAQRIRTGEWLHNDIPLIGAQRSTDLNAPGQLTASLNPELREIVADDGLPVIDGWSTALYPINDLGEIANKQGFLVLPPEQYDDDAGTVINAAGFTALAAGFIYTDAYNWGEFADPIAIARDHWTWIQSQPTGDLGMQLIGEDASNRIIGSNAEPYRLAFYDIPDLGSEIDTLAVYTPFDYAVEHDWATESHYEVVHRLRFGYPRIGAVRTDLRFVQGENITLAPALSSTEGYANEIIGIGNGEGSTMVVCRVSVDDGRLRRTRTLTDKTITDVEVLKERCRTLLDTLGKRVEPTQVTVNAHRNAPLAELRVGDDIRVEAYQPGYGESKTWQRITSIVYADDVPGEVTLNLVRSSAFRYAPTEEVNT